MVEKSFTKIERYERRLEQVLNNRVRSSPILKICIVQVSEKVEDGNRLWPGKELLLFRMSEEKVSNEK